MNEFYSLPPTPNDIYHYGIKRKSGRYPWGSGKRPYQSDHKPEKLMDTIKDVVKYALSINISRVTGRDQALLFDMMNRDFASQSLNSHLQTMQLTNMKHPS